MPGNTRAISGGLAGAVDVLIPLLLSIEDLQKEISATHGLVFNWRISLVEQPAF
jgi:hypothetical protein